MNEDEIGNRVDRKLEAEERRISADYSEALKRAMKKSKAFFKAVEELDAKGAPAWCVNDDQKARWRERQLRDLEKKYRPFEAIADELVGAGQTAVSSIKHYGEDVYNTSYTMTQEQLGG